MNTLIKTLLSGALILMMGPVFGDTPTPLPPPNYIVMSLDHTCHFQTSELSVCLDRGVFENECKTTSFQVNPDRSVFIPQDYINHTVTPYCKTNTTDCIFFNTGKFPQQFSKVVNNGIIMVHCL